MWQRKQTLFLLVSAVIMALLFFLPMAQVTPGASSGSEASLLTALGLKNPFSGAYSQFKIIPIVLDFLVVLLSIVTIFLYKNRRLQMRISIFNILLTVGFIGSIAFEAYKAKEAVDGIFMITPWLFVPLVAIFFFYLAIRGMIADEILIRSANRLR